MTRGRMDEGRDGSRGKEEETKDKRGVAENTIRGVGEASGRGGTKD